jgi:four helix bundle protein
VFRQQVLWQKAQTFGLALTRLVAELPHNRSADILGNQLLRAGTSIAANIAEGYGRYSQAAYRSHLSIARGSALEAESWLDLLEQAGYLTQEMAEKLLLDCIELQKLLTLRMRSQSQGKTYASRLVPK